MRRQPGQVVLLCLAAVGLGGVVSGEVKAATATRVVQGEIVQVEGELYVLKDLHGQEIRLHVDAKTDRLDHAMLEVGDPVVAYVTPEGHVTSISNLGPPDEIEHEDVRKPGRAPTPPPKAR